MEGNLNIHTIPSVHTDANNESDDEDSVTEEIASGERVDLQDALEAENHTFSLPEHAEQTIEECSFAAAALATNDATMIESLPLEDPDALDLIRSSLGHLLTTIKSLGPAEASYIQKLMFYTVSKEEAPTGLPTYIQSGTVDLVPLVGLTTIPVEADFFRVKSSNIRVAIE
ncbi:hypothetical protein BDQ17DRAFT_1433483 [Cyathus striatus]|nr:hypothetical protein BDQ17DRAFT_1433483 [Cyathus striatus]